MPALPGAVLAGLLVYAAGAGLLGVVAVVLLAQAGLALAVSRVPVPMARGSALLALVVGVVASLGTARDPQPPLVVLAAALGTSFVVALVLQLARRDGRARLTPSLMLTATALVAVAAPSAVVAGWLRPDGPGAVQLGAGAVAVVLLAELVPAGSTTLRRAARLVAVAVAVGAALLLARAGWPYAVGVQPAGVVAALAAAPAAVAALLLSGVDRARTELATATAGTRADPG